MSFVASFGYAAPVWSVASPNPSTAAFRSRWPAPSSASRNVKLFFGCGNGASNACWLMLTSPSSGFTFGGS